MTAEELMTIANMGKGTDMSSYEHFAIADKTGRRVNGATVYAVAAGSAALLLGAAAWIGSTMYTKANSKGNQRAIDLLATTAINERNERVAQQNFQTQQVPSVLDIIRINNVAQSGAGAGAGATANAVAQAEAVASILGMNGLGRTNQANPLAVSLYQPAMPCCCPNPCGCNQ